MTTLFHPFKIITIGIVLFLTSCQNNQKVINDPSVIMEYEKNQSEENLNKLIKEYETLIQSVPLDKKTLPGIYTEYAFLLYKKGNKDQALKMIQQEISLYPESKVYLDAVIKYLIK